MGKTAEIIYDYVAEHWGMNEVQYSMFLHFSTDQIVDWFYCSFFHKDEEDMREELGDEYAQMVIDHYNQHCA